MQVYLKKGLNAIHASRGGVEGVFVFNDYSYNHLETNFAFFRHFATNEVK